MSRRTETAYTTQSPGKLAQHNEALDSGDRVNAALGVSLWSLTCIAKVHVLIRGDLSGVRPFGSARYGNIPGDRAEVSRGHSRCGSRHRRYGDWKRAATHNVEDIVEVSPHRRAKHEEKGSPIKGRVKRKNTSPWKKINFFSLEP